MLAQFSHPNRKRANRKRKLRSWSNKACQLSPTAQVGNALTGDLGVIDVLECTEADDLAALKR